MDARPTKARTPEAWMATVPESTRALCEEVCELIAEAAPDLTQSIKWNMLAFSGLASVVFVGAFKRHVSVFFHRGVALPDPAGLFCDGTGAQMRAVKLQALAPDARSALRALIRSAEHLDAQGAPPPAPKIKRPPPEVPPALASALRRDKAASAGFDALSPSCQREYVNWLTQAKRPETRERRLRETLAALRRGAPWSRRRDGAG